MLCPQIVCIYKPSCSLILKTPLTLVSSCWLCHYTKAEWMSLRESSIPEGLSGFDWKYHFSLPCKKPWVQIRQVEKKKYETVGVKYLCVYQRDYAVYRVVITQDSAPLRPLRYQFHNPCWNRSQITLVSRQTFECSIHEFLMLLDNCRLCGT